MLKKNYEGLDVAFVPVTGADIIRHQQQQLAR